MLIKVSHLFGFFYDFDKIIYGLGFNLILKRNDNRRKLYRVKEGNAGSIIMGDIIKKLEKLCCFSSFDTSNHHRIILQNVIIMTNVTIFEKERPSINIFLMSLIF